MDINELKLGELKQLLALLGSNLGGQKTAADSAWEVGSTYLIRTVTMIDSGRLVAVTDHELVLEDAAWIADTGRFSDALCKAEFNEVEPFPDGRVIVGRGAVVDAVKIAKAPRLKK